MKPMLFSDPMVRAILDGRKVQTRRLANGPGFPTSSPWQVGDVLWVRECWRLQAVGGSCDYISIWYRADGAVRQFDVPSGLSAGITWKWHPSIHMPRWACRLFLNVTRVRCERLQDITEADAIAEGFEYCPPLPLEPRNKFAEAWDALYFYPQPIKQKGTIVGYRSFPWDGTPETRTHKIGRAHV